ncbi:hypothetical protein M3P36_05820 [Altererythrobacter sp. KTW20L]|uniref:hypothetical protein n=1 Tax=Altererythrobacter sp. KTW20L TaxID=2942210 RepID=UPI0020BE6319|nr:hypothetical protein [Altererythrobacter sp. KTW20L]MCL6250560.1 hypothetical protein [Altererythrobacter sp. KTW20L]
MSDSFSRDRLPKAIYVLQIGSVAGSGLPGVLVAMMLQTVKEPPRRNISRNVSNVPLVGAVKYLWLQFCDLRPAVHRHDAGCARQRRPGLAW